MKYLTRILVTTLIISPLNSIASNGYTITGQSGIMYFVAIEKDVKNNEDVYRLAVGEACSGRSVCQVQFWVGSAPRKFPLTDEQVASKVVHWQQNLNTGLRRWLVKCSLTNLFSKERECM